MPPKSKVRVRVASGESKRKSVVFNYFGSLCDGETQWDDKNFYCKICCEKVVSKFPDLVLEENADFSAFFRYNYC